MCTIRGVFIIVVIIVLLPVFPACGTTKREYISIVGSSTVYPFITAVAEKFGKSTSFKTPKVESTGTGRGFSIFCMSNKIETPDMVSASRRITAGEFQQCVDNGVAELVEIKIGYDGIVLAHSKNVPPMSLTNKQIYLALAGKIPNPAAPEQFIDNPYTSWNEIDDSLPKIKIGVMGPPPSSGTRDAFVSLLMEKGCEQIPAIAALKQAKRSQYDTLCQSIRIDGAYIETGENDNIIVQKLEMNPTDLGILGYNFLDQNRDKLQGSLLDGVAADYKSIAARQYEAARPLYLYVKKSHIPFIPGINEFLYELTREETWGEEGYLREKGLIPASQQERQEFRKDALLLKDFTL